LAAARDDTGNRVGKGTVKMTQQRIAVLGAGANGASIGADLTRAGLNVTLIEQWPEHVQAMRERGIRIEMPEETLVQPVRVINLCEVAAVREKFDVVLVLMKAYDTRWACQLIEPYLKPDSLVVGVQNGMTTDIIASVVGASRTMGCVIEISSTMFTAGVVQRDSPPGRSWFAVGAIDPEQREREAEIAELLRFSGSVEIVDNIRATKWMKLVSNATTLVTTAILGQPMIEAIKDPRTRNFMIRSGEEALTVGGAMGYPLLPIFGLSAADLGDRERAVEVLLDTLMAGFVLATTKTTVLQDWMKGRHSEVDDLNGLVVREALAHEIPTPVNAAVVDFAHRIESGELAPGLGNLEPMLALAGHPKGAA
jgi:2-dehydropantoate 2-reductase